MSSFIKLSILLISLCVISAEYRNKIEPFSFDIQKFEYPLEFLKMGTTVALRDVIKLIPKVENRYGGLFMSQVSSNLSSSLTQIIFMIACGNLFV